MKKLLIISYSIITVGIIVLGILSILMNQNEKALDQKQEQRYQSYLLADQLRQSSDDLTRAARTYVLTSNVQYEKMYWDILAIRNGEKPRPQGYDRIYWDLVLNEGDKPRADAETIALQALMKKNGFTEEEFAKLREAQNNSDELVKMETIAMNAIKGLYDDGTGHYVKKGEPDFEMARRIMHDEQYHKHKAAIMKPIDEFLRLLNERTKAEVEYYEKMTNVLVFIIQLVVLSLAVLSIFIGIFVTRRLLKQIGGEPDQIAQIAEQVANGKLDIQFELTGKTTGIYAALQVMVKNLISINADREEQNWVKTGQAQLNEQISGEQSIKQLAENVIDFLTAYMKSQVGAFYLLEETSEQKTCLKMIATHAYVWRKNTANSFELGESIVGQAGFEKKMFVITQPPEDYIYIQSGLGGSLPRAILVIPFLYENTLKGVIELASFTTFTETQLQFIEQVMPNIAIAVNTAESRIKMQKLLDQSQTQAKTLQVQQAELQNTNEELQSQTEELQTQQEELRQANEELEERSQTLERQQAAIQEKNVELEKAKVAIQTKAEELDIASKYKSEFLANMSHELRTPLNSLLILSQLLSGNKEGNLTETQQKYANTIYSSGHDLLTLINDILDLSKVEAGKIEINPTELKLTELSASFEEKFRHIADEKGLTFSIELADNLPSTLYTDEQRLRQVVTNLLSNAFKFTAEGGVILNIQHARREVDLSRSGLDSAKAIAISVTDTGIGVPQDKQKVIFEAFQQADGTTNRRYGGTGLGLSISRQLIQLLGGEIQLCSEEGKGSTFTLYIPERLKKNDLDNHQTSQMRPVGNQNSISSEVSEASVSAERTEQQASLSPPIPEDDRNNLQPDDKSILIIEDDRNFSDILLELAKEKGFKYLRAEDGKSGLQVAQEYKPNAIILDISLPQVDGWTVMEKLKENPDTRHIPVHFVSASDVGKDAIKMGAIGYCLKPVSMDELSKAFNKIESFISQTMKNLLVVVDNPEHRQAIVDLVKSGNIQPTVVTTCAQAWQNLQSKSYDCIILDMTVEQNTGIQLLEQLNNEAKWRQIPVITYVERDLTTQEEVILQNCADHLIIKETHSPERLLDEVTLFLHEIESKLSEKQQQMLRKVRDKEAILAGKKLLLVDDDMRNVFAIASVLEEKGIEVISADNGQEAIDILNDTPDIAAVLMDIMMPEMDGYEATQKIRAQSRFRKLPIIALTAKAMKGDKAKCIEAGANDYLAKPIDADRLLSLLRVWLYQ